MFELTNPLPQQLRDTEKLRNFYREWNLVPYAGNSTASSHRFLSILCDLYDLSPSQGDCIESLKSWCFGSNLDLVVNPVEGMVSDPDLVSAEEKKAWGEWMKSLGVSPVDILEITKLLFQDYKKTGNAWLIYRETVVGEAKAVSLEFTDSLKVMFLNTEPDEPKAVVVSNDFFAGTWLTEEPKLYRVFPEFTEEENGQRVTMFHFKNKRDHSDWYGRPDSLQSLFWQFVEWRSTVRTAKITDSDTTSKGILAVQAHHPAGNVASSDGEPDGFSLSTLASAIRKTTTNRGDFQEAESLGFMKYPHGANPPTMIPLDLNRDYQWDGMIFSQASNRIFSAHQWSQLLTGLQRTSGSIGGNTLIDELITKESGTVAPIQRTWERRIKVILDQMADFSGMEEMKRYSPRYTDKITKVIEKLRETKKEDATDNSDRSGSDQTQ